MQDSNIPPTKGEAKCLNAAGMFFLLTGNLPKALELHLEALKKYESIHDQNGIGRALNQIGANYGLQGDYRKTLKYN